MTGGTNYPALTPYQTATADYRDSEINRLRYLLGEKETALREAYMSIGELHQEVLSLQGFKQWSESMTEAKKAQSSL
jgi:hypothetical protein